jgi:hypothetical protein
MRSRVLRIVFVGVLRSEDTRLAEQLVFTMTDKMHAARRAVRHDIHFESIVVPGM